MIVISLISLYFLYNLLFTFSLKIHIYLIMPQIVKSDTHCIYAQIITPFFILLNEVNFLISLNNAIFSTIQRIYVYLRMGINIHMVCMHLFTQSAYNLADGERSIQIAAPLRVKLSAKI